ncbi:hypothetical protein ZORO111903_19480 [Zobellia roscoffensis]
MSSKKETIANLLIFRKQQSVRLVDYLGAFNLNYRVNLFIKKKHPQIADVLFVLKNLLVIYETYSLDKAPKPDDLEHSLLLYIASKATQTFG